MRKNGGNNMPTEAEKKANERWKKNNAILINFRLYKNTDQDLIEYIQSLDNVQGTIKQALREYKEAHK